MEKGTFCVLSCSLEEQQYGIKCPSFHCAKQNKKISNSLLVKCIQWFCTHATHAWQQFMLLSVLLAGFLFLAVFSHCAKCFLNAVHVSNWGRCFPNFLVFCCLFAYIFQVAVRLRATVHTVHPYTSTMCSKMLCHGSRLYNSEFNDKTIHHVKQVIKISIK